MPVWEQRIARARELAATTPPAAAILAFYADLAAVQASFCGRGRGRASDTAAFPDAVDIDRATAAVPGFLGWLQRRALEPLRQVAARSAELDDATWHRRLRDYLTAIHETGGPLDREPLLDFVAEAVLQPFAEAAGGRGGEPAGRRLGVAIQASRCPTCGGKPLVGVLREEGNGASRSLVCGLCSTEWAYLRTRCPVCDEQNFDALPVYTTDLHETARVESCDTCRHYLKTIDLTKNALAVPLVDDLASLPIDLWAREQGYRRIRPNLLRT